MNITNLIGKKRMEELVANGNNSKQQKRQWRRQKTQKEKRDKKYIESQTNENQQTNEQTTDRPNKRMNEWTSNRQPIIVIETNDRQKQQTIDQQIIRNVVG